MFDYVDYKTLCPKCGTDVGDFQSKDGPCTMNTLEPKDVRHFYSSCNSCHTWIDVEVIPHFYELKVTTTEDKWGNK